MAGNSSSNGLVIFISFVKKGWMKTACIPFSYVDDNNLSTWKRFLHAYEATIVSPVHSCTRFASPTCEPIAAL